MARRSIVAGVDIGRYAVKAVWAELRSGKSVITRSETLRLPSDRFDPATVITPWFEKVGLLKVPCVIALPGATSIFQPILVPPDDRRTFAQITSMEVIKFNEMASETMIYSFTPVELNAGERRLLLAMARPTLINTTISNAVKLGLDVIDIVPMPAAIFNALQAETPGSSTPDTPPTLYLSIGASTTEIAIGSTPSGMMFARTFAGGGQMFTDALAKAGGITASQAESQKLNEGALIKDSPTAPALVPIADRWIQEVQSCLAVYRNLYPDRKAMPANAVITGGGAELRGFAEYVAARIGMPVTVPSMLPASAGTIRAASFTGAAGLALAGLRATPSGLSLLPGDLRDELTFRDQKPFWIAAGIAAAMILAVSLIGGYLDFQRKTDHLNKQKASLKIRQALAADIEHTKDRSTQLIEMTHPIRNELTAAPIMRDLISLISIAKAPNDSITLVCDAESYFSKDRPLGGRRPMGLRDNRRNIKPVQAPAGSTNVFERVVIEGFTRTPNLTTVKTLITNLTASGYVETADLLSDDKLVADPGLDPQAFQQHFVIDVKLANR